ncbi:MAG: hypothetical protein UHX00_13145 [Caryophanon sp.]|nr:hypothetical protein [Caryophanon sp.]
MSSDEQGFTLLDAILSLFIWSTCALFLLPMYSDLRDSLLNAKHDVHVAETMQHAARQLVHSGMSSGQLVVDAMAYEYVIDLPTICVRYTIKERDMETCKDFSNETTALHS